MTHSAHFQSIKDHILQRWEDRELTPFREANAAKERERERRVEEYDRGFKNNDCLISTMAVIDCHI